MILRIALASSLLLAIAPGWSESPAAAWLGVRLAGNEEGGATVTRVIAGSPAERYGLRASDVIIAIDGEPVSGFFDLVAAIRDRDVRQWISLDVRRGDDDLSLDARLTTRPADAARARPRTGWVGVRAIDLPPRLRVHFGAPENAGVMISDVADGGPAEIAGLRLGDVVYEVDGRPVSDRRSLFEAIAGGGVGNLREVRLVRDGAEIVAEVSIAEAPVDGEPR